ncbi:MAG: beta-lactamase family protein [Verrucomicrobiota bacterium]|nr:beta-lactamase family protein [Verrucomicrobiota bacterium]
MGTLGAALLLLGLLAAAPGSAATFHRLDGTSLTTSQIDAEVARLMKERAVPGLAVALIEEGQPVFIKTYGFANVEHKRPLEKDTILYAASLTKLAFAYTVMQLVDEKVVDLDRSIAKDLPKPLPEYEKYGDLAGDERWRKLTPRILLDHTTGFPNFRFINADGKLDFKFEPGTRYAYSGEGINLLQFVLEAGLGLDLGKEMQKRVFDRFGMKRTSMTWRADFAPNFADGYDEHGKREPHDERESVRAAGSMDTTIEDYAKFLAGFLRGEGISAKGRAEMLRPQIAIKSAHQFPPLDPAENPANAEIKLSAGLGCVLFQSAAGPAFCKGGHNEWTDNLAIGLPHKKRGLLLMSNSILAETIYPALVKFLWGDTHMPWSWEYNLPGLPPPVSMSDPGNVLQAREMVRCSLAL